MNFTPYTLVPLPIPLYLPSTFATSCTKKINQKETKPNHLVMEAVACHTVHSLVLTFLFRNVHCNKSLFWPEASGLCYTFNTDPRWDSLQISWCFPVSWRLWSFGSSAVHKCRFLGLDEPTQHPGSRTGVVAKLVRLTDLPHQYHQGKASSTDCSS